MELNKIAGAVLLVLLVAMVFSKIGNILVPPHYAAHKSGDDHGGATAPPEKPVPEPTFAVAINAATDAQGKSQSNKCLSCHSFEKGGANKVGPNLWNIVGRKKGSHAGYAYSSAMKNADGVWTMEEIYKYLKDPQGVVKGTKMAFRLTKADQRGAVIRFLRTQSDNPVPLPKVEPAADKKPEDGKPAPKTDDVKKDEPKKDEPAKDDEKKDN